MSACTEVFTFGGEQIRREQRKQKVTGSHPFTHRRNTQLLQPARRPSVHHVHAVGVQRNNASRPDLGGQRLAANHGCAHPQVLHHSRVDTDIYILIRPSPANRHKVHTHG